MEQIIKARPGAMLLLGKVGEHRARSVQFDLTGWKETYGPGTAQLLVRRSGEELPYPVEITQEDDCVVWTVHGAELACPGMGYCKLRYYRGETVVKSELWLTFVLEGAADPQDPPAPPAENWLERMLKSEAQMKTAAQEVRQAQQAVENMTVSAETVESGQQAGVSKTVEDGVVHLCYTIPRGTDGKSAYDLAREGGYAGTEQTFARALAVYTSSEDREELKRELVDGVLAALSVYAGEVENV